MGVLYIVAAEKGAGKTALCAGIARNLTDSGKKVGYMKSPADSDTAFMKQVLGPDGIVSAKDITGGKDVVLVEGALGPNAADKASQAAYAAAAGMKAKAIAVEAYSGRASGYADAYKGFGGNLLGVVLNKVPSSQLKRARDEATRQFGAAGIKVLGVIPENRALLAITIGELAESVQGKILNSAEKADELVENFMLGAMIVDSGLEYFGRKTNKAAIVRQDRPDMQLAALETPTRCLVLTGSQQPPVYNVRQRAESRGIPIITTAAATGDIVAGIEDSLAKARLNQAKKLDRLAELVKQNLDMKAVISPA